MARIETRTGVLFGWAAVAVWTVLYLVAGFSTPGYSLTGSALSDLGNPASGAPWAFNSACILAGLFFLPFAWTLGAGLSPWVRRVGSLILTIAAVFLILLGVFHEGSPYNLHFIFSALFFLSFMVVISHYAIAMWKSSRYGPVSGILSVIASGFALVFIEILVLENLVSPPITESPVSNLLEHLTVFAGLVWAAWNGWRLWHATPTASRGTAS